MRFKRIEDLKYKDLLKISSKELSRLFRILNAKSSSEALYKIRKMRYLNKGKRKSHYIVIES